MLHELLLLFRELDPNWVSALANCVMALGVFLAWIQLRLTFKKHEYEYASFKRGKAIELGVNWVRNHNERSSDALKLMIELSDPDIKRVRNRESLLIDQSLLPFLSRALPKATFPQINNFVEVSADQSAELRWLVVSHLNELEVIFSAWMNDVADQEMIEQEFSGLVRPEKNDYLAERFRKVNDVDSWPAIAFFCDEFRKKSSSIAQGKKPLLPEHANTRSNLAWCFAKFRELPQIKNNRRVL